MPRFVLASNARSRVQTPVMYCQRIDKHGITWPAAIGPLAGDLAVVDTELDVPAIRLTGGGPDIVFDVQDEAFAGLGRVLVDQVTQYVIQLRRSVHAGSNRKSTGPQCKRRRIVHFEIIIPAVETGGTP